MDQVIYVFYFKWGDPIARVSQPFGSINSAMEWVKNNPDIVNTQLVVGTVIGVAD